MDLDFVLASGSGGGTGGSLNMKKFESKVVEKLTCPDCGNDDLYKFYAGPRGGAAINVTCGVCGCKINVAPLPDGRWWVYEKLKDGEPKAR